MITLTPAGKKANEILDWAYRDLSRVPEAQKRVIALGTDLPAGSQARNEVGDVATQLSRLADTSGTMPTTSITAQAEGA